MGQPWVSRGLVHSMGDDMRRVILATALLVAATGAAQAKTWVAVCTDGQNLQLNITPGAGGQLYVKSEKGTFEIASLDAGVQTNGYYCAAESGQGGVNATIQLCIQKAGKIFVLSQKIPGAKPEIPSVCKASVIEH
jgi:hypothetical protein